MNSNSELASQERLTLETVREQLSSTESPTERARIALELFELTQSLRLAAIHELISVWDEAELDLPTVAAELGLTEESLVADLVVYQNAIDALVRFELEK